MIVAVLEKLRESWESLVALVDRLDQLSGSVDPMRMELFVLQEAGLSFKFHAVGLVYTHGYYNFLCIQRSTRILCQSGFVFERTRVRQIPTEER